jgi:hypothetical protein
MVSLLQRLPFSNAGVPAQQKGSKRLCPTTRCLARARHALSPAIVVNGAPRSKAKARRPDSRPDYCRYPNLLWERACSRRTSTITRPVWMIALSGRPSRASPLPQWDCGQSCNQVGCQAASLCFCSALAFDFLAPSRGFVPVLRSGQPGMDAGLAAHDHGWSIAAGPRSRTGARHRTPGARAFGYFAPGGVPLFKVTRCKSETIGGRYRWNGYVHLKENWLTVRAPSPASLAPTVNQ